MIKKLIPLVVLTLLAFMLLTSCEQPGATMAMIIGSINIDPYSESEFGGAEFHVVLIGSGTTVNPFTPGSVDAVTPLVKLDGTFPGTGGNLWTTNYMITDVPAGTYFAFVWIDNDGDGTFVRANGDYFGFYDANTLGSGLWFQPDTPNIVVPDVGLVDIDIWCGYEPPN